MSGDLTTRRGILDSIETSASQCEGHKMIFQILTDSKKNDPEIYEMLMGRIEAEIADGTIKDVLDLQDYLDYLTFQLLFGN